MSSPPHGRTVQIKLRKAAEDFLGENVDLGVSRRTDAGVHAFAQVGQLRTPLRRSVEQIQREVNERLPADIHLLFVDSSPERFHVLHSALSRCDFYWVFIRQTALAKVFV